MTADRTCELNPFLSPVVAQVSSLEQAGSALEILTQALENYLARMKAAICADLQQIVDECCGGGPGATSFLDLTDTPDSYAGQALELVRVNAGETGLEFWPLPSIPETFLDLTDTPGTYAGSANYAVVVDNAATALQFRPFPSSGAEDLRKWRNFMFALVAGTTLQTIGNGGGSSAGTSTFPALTTASVSASIYKLEIVTASAANAITYAIYGALSASIGTSTSIGGFRWRACVGQNSTIANRRAFFGFRNVTTNPTSVNPSSQVNIIGFGYDSGDANLQIMHNDAALTATKVDLGAGFAIAAGDLYELELACEPGSGVVTYSATNLNTGVQATGTISTDLPANTLFLAHGCWLANAATAGIARLWFRNQYLSDY